jgi:hypothetical protein
MMRGMLFLALVLASCSNAQQADLPRISDARSLAAEWALVNEQAITGHVTGAYLSTMRASLREQLETAASSLNYPQSSYGAEIAALLREPDNAAPGELRAHVNKLRREEARLESA